MIHKYTAVTFAPIQLFIEVSRKLRDLFGASIILSYLSEHIAQAAGVENVISPGLIRVQRGMPNRILIKGDFSYEQTSEAILYAWKKILHECQTWVRKELQEFEPYYWDEEWKNWENHAWEIFWGSGTGKTEAEAIIAAMEDLENRKLSRSWKAVNWMGESSSLTGADAIAFPKLGNRKLNKEHSFNYRVQEEEISRFYARLAEITNNPSTSETPEDNNAETPEGKFISPNERLSIPELAKRLVTWSEIQPTLEIAGLKRGFREIQRKPTQETPGQWTGWFMGDGDKVGDKLKDIAKKGGEQGIRDFTTALRNWGRDFYRNNSLDLYHNNSLGRVIYAGGDDFLGVIYSKNPAVPIPTLKAFDFLMTLPQKWKKHKQNITLSVGFVWVAGSVPQRDVLQHCREAQHTAKSRQRNRVTIRIVFNSGQYVEWTCPWCWLHILKKYRDRDGKTFGQCEPNEDNYKPENYPNWSHIYSDLAQLKARHAFGLAPNRREINVNSLTRNQQNKIIDNRDGFLEFFDSYFPGWGNKLKRNKIEKYIVGASQNASNTQRAKAMIDWVEDLITVGWYLCSNSENT